MSKQQARSWVRRNCKFAQVDDEQESEITPLLDNGLVEEDVVESGKYRVLGIPEEFGKWFLWYQEDDDGRGGVMGSWYAIQELQDGAGDEWEATSSPKEAYDWVMRNYKNPDSSIGAAPATRTPNQVNEELYDAYKARDDARIRQLLPEYQKLNPGKTKPSFMASRKTKESP